MIVGVLQLDVHVPGAHSLKDRRSVLKSLKDRLRGRFNVAVAELDSTEKWQRATIGIAALGDDRAYVDGLLREVIEWTRMAHPIALIRIEQTYF